MARYKQIRDLALIIADEFDMYPHIAEEIILSEFKYIKSYMEQGFTYSVRVANLGLLKPRKRFTKFNTIKEYFIAYGSNKKRSDKIRLY